MHDALVYIWETIQLITSLLLVGFCGGLGARVGWGVAQALKDASND